MLTKNSNLIVENKNNDGLKMIFFFEFFAIPGQFELKKKCEILFFQLFFSNTKKFPWFPDWKTSLTSIFFPNDG